MTSRRIAELEAYLAHWTERERRMNAERRYDDADVAHAWVKIHERLLAKLRATVAA